MELMETLQFYRKRQGLSQVELAEALDVSRQTISKWETGAALPSAENLLALSRLYGVPVDVLLKGGESEAAPEAAPPLSPPPEATRTALPRRTLILRIVFVTALFDLLFYPVDFDFFEGFQDAFYTLIAFELRIIVCLCIGLWFGHRDRSYSASTKRSVLISAAALAVGTYCLLFYMPGFMNVLFDWISGGYDLESGYNLPAHLLRMCIAQNLCDSYIFFSHMCLVAAFQLSRLFFSKKRIVRISQAQTVHQV